MHLLLGVTGSVAAIQLPLLVKALHERQAGLTIRVICTQNASHFLKTAAYIRKGGEEIRPLVDAWYTDASEWHMWSEMGDPVLHIQVMEWADALLIAPCDANTLSKVANGACDNMLTSVVRAWPFDANQHVKKPVIVAPAMNTNMWDHPVTAPQLAKLRTWGMTVVDPIEKVLACDRKGIGAMADPNSIVDVVMTLLQHSEL